MDESTAVARRMDGSVEIAQGWTPVSLREAIARETEMRAIVIDYYRSCMQENHHFYRLMEDKSVKPALSKEGALNLCSLFKVTPMADPPVELYSPDGHYTVRYRVNIVSKETGEIVARGDGLCTSRESKYAYRMASRVCPACGKEAIIKGREEYGGGWVCFRKKDGCGAKYRDGDAQIESQAAGRTANEDLADQWNTILKMSEKRATVDAVLKLPLVSELFTQDLEESIQERLRSQGANASTEGAETEESSKASDAQTKPEPETSDHPTAQQIKNLKNTAKSTDIELRTWVKVIGQAMNLPSLATASDRFLQTRMTMAQYEAVETHYRNALKESVESEDDVQDYSGTPATLQDATDADPSAEAAVTEARATREPADGQDGKSGVNPRDDEGRYASPDQIEALKRLAQQVGDEASVDVQDMLDHHPEGIMMAVYDIVMDRLRGRRDSTKTGAKP